ALAPEAAQLSVFQRTPAWILPKPDRSHSDAQRSLRRRLPLLQRARRSSVYWRLEMLGMSMIQPALRKPVEWRAKAHLRCQVHDENLRAQLRPRYALGCKRVLWS